MFSAVTSPMVTPSYSTRNFVVPMAAERGEGFHIFEIISASTPDSVFRGRSMEVTVVLLKLFMPFARISSSPNIEKRDS